MDSGVDSEVVFNTGDHEDQEETPEMSETPESRTPPTPITQRDMDIIIRGWEEKFSKIVECLREVQLTSERASSDMCLVGQEARTQSQEHDRRLSDFLRKFEDIDALRASTPRRYPTFGYQPSPVGREEVSHPPSSLPHFESARTEDEEENDEPRNSLPHASSARTGEHSLFRDTRTRDHDDDRDTRTRKSDNSRVRALRTKRKTTNRATRCRTQVVRAQGNTCCSETRAPGNTTVETRAPYNFVLITTTGILQTTKTTQRSHARHRVRRCPHSMVLTLPNLGLGSYNSRPSRAIRAGQQGNGSSAWSPR